MPVLFGGAMLLASLPGCLMMLLAPDRNSGSLGILLVLLLGAGALIGFWFVLFGLRICSHPGSWTYRITHGHIFPR